MSNTISTRTYRDKYRLANLDILLRKALVAEKICMVDRDSVKVILNPYGSQATTVVQAIAGTYTPATYTTTDESLTVDNEFIVAEQIFDFESTLARFDLFADRLDEQQYSVAQAIDSFVINCLTADATTTTYSTAVGGFTSASNINGIMADLISKVAGYADAYRGMFLVLENTDITGFIKAQATNGFNYADSALNNGFMTNYMGVNIYVVRAGTYVTATVGTRTFTNVGHRVFGVNNSATYASPRGVTFEEKGVSGKTGKEVVTYGYIGFRLWATKIALVVNITLN